MTPPQSGPTASATAPRATGFSVIGLALMLIPTAIALVGVWVGSSLAVFHGGSIALAVGGSVVLGFIIPLIWELRADPNQRGGRLRDAILRSSVLSMALVVGLLATYPTDTFKALATRGDWFLDDAEGENADAVRDVLYAMADRLEWLYDATREEAFRDDAPDAADVPGLITTPIAGPAGIGANGTDGTGAVTWPLPSTVHPLVASMPEAVKESIESIGTYIAAGESDPIQRVKALHDFVATHIAYDVEGLRDGSAMTWEMQSPKVVLESRRAVCAGYSKLMVALGAITGDALHYIVGDARQARDYADLASTNSLPAEGAGHAWNALELDGHWYLMDVTWDAGHVGPDGFTARYQTDYFLTPPTVFRVRHLPDEARLQLTDSEISRAQWLRLPLTRPWAHRVGVSLISPTQPMVDVDGDLRVELDNPRGAIVTGATYALDSGDVLDRCKAHGTSAISCPIPDDRVRAVLFLKAPGTKRGRAALTLIVDG